MLYQFVFRLFFARLNPETAHHLVVAGLRAAGKLGLTKLVRLRASKTKTVQAMGLTFHGAFGLAAGFDKDAKLIRELSDLGFSHIEVGTVTAKAQPGNDKPRLFRLIKDRALINRMGFNNEGADAMATRLAKLSRRPGDFVLGVNIGKSKVTEVEHAVDDYRYSAQKLAPFADYLAVNVSSPNTPGLRSLQSVEALRPILEAVQDVALGKPVLVKIAPDLADQDILDVAKLAKDLKLAGVIATNTTITRSGLSTPANAVESFGAGGLSGAPLKGRSLEVLHLLRNRLGENQIVISVGGVETRDEMLERLEAGATLVQGYTAFIYEGPFWARRLNREN